MCLRPFYLCCESVFNTSQKYLECVIYLIDITTISLHHQTQHTLIQYQGWAIHRFRCIIARWFGLSADNRINIDIHYMTKPHRQYTDRLLKIAIVSTMSDQAFYIKKFISDTTSKQHTTLSNKRKLLFSVPYKIKEAYLIIFLVFADRYYIFY